MAMRRPRTGYRRQGLHQGVGFVWFTLIAMPMALFSMGLATDFTRLVMAGHQMRNVADAGAVAGAWQTQVGQVVLEEPEAIAAAEGTVCRYWSEIRGVSPSRTGAPVPNCSQTVTMTTTLIDENDPTLEFPGNGYRGVEVSVEYEVRDLLIPSYFGIADDFTDGVATKTARVCIPGDTDGFSNGYCDRQ